MFIATEGNLSSGFITTLTITKGETVALAMDLSTDCATPINLTGYSLKCRIQFATPLDLTTGNSGITIVNAAAGQVQLNISSATSAAFAVGSYAFDLWMVSAGGIETPLLAGQFVVVANVTPVP